MSTRVHTDKLWRQDELLRKATDEDRAKFPRMVTAGPLLAEIYIREHLGLEKLDPEDSNPIYARAYVRRGKAQVERGEYKDALEDFKAALDLDATSQEAYLARADLYAKTGDAKRAEADRKKAAEIKG